MFAQLPERQMHVVRWILTIAWLLIIASLFYDPWTPVFTDNEVITEAGRELLLLSRQSANWRD
jgi:hypothetical protein